ncbi:MAG: hypothetical protein CVT48_03135 [Thermoplasmata archaeon HGW-Thermoplasmata-1]|nr:MAG: hypothetical protein CVT48_03135 [Thermoplasmata archaeon HGW-Thermoplasmata-1]
MKSNRVAVYTMAALLAFVSLASLAGAQTVGSDRMVLGEYFGADWCGYCPRGAKENHEFAEAHEDYIYIKYDADENLAITVGGAQAVDRGKYYGVAFIPDTIVDGKSDVYPDSVTIEQRYTLAAATPAFADLSLDGSFIDAAGGYDTAKMMVKIQIDATLAVGGPDVALFVVPIENNASVWQEDWNHVYTSDDASMQEWHHLVRMLDQQPFGPMQPGESKTLDFTYALTDIKSRQVEDEDNGVFLKTPEEHAKTLGVTVFIQDLATREIFQAAQITYLPIVEPPAPEEPPQGDDENETQQKTPGFGVAIGLSSLAAIGLALRKRK